MDVLRHCVGNLSNPARIAPQADPETIAPKADQEKIA
jgi:hypothetical protein